jgi:hypothetical protein
MFFLLWGREGKLWLAGCLGFKPRECLWNLREEGGDRVTVAKGLHDWAREMRVMLCPVV